MRLGAPGRRRAVDLLRWIFLAAVLVCAWWGMRGRWDEVADALRATHWSALPLATGFVAVGLLITQRVWSTLLRGFGRDLPSRTAAAIFFVGQLGKYLPGSVWSIGAQADLARRHRVPMRTTAAASLQFLGVQVATGVSIAGLTSLTGLIHLEDLNGLGRWGSAELRWVVLLLLVGSLVAVTPWVLNRCGTLVAGGDVSGQTLSTVGSILVRQALVWSSYGAALVLLAPDPSLARLGLVSGAFAASYAIGVLVVLAPAGVGVREAVLVGLLAPTYGLAAAAAAALLARVLHTVVDLALAAWASLRSRAACSGPPEETSDPSGRTADPAEAVR